MCEIKRLYGRKTVFLLMALVLINMGLFMLSCAPDREITLTGEALEEYIAGYPDFLARTKENSAALSSMNMYKSGFAADNIRRSAMMYSRLENITVETGDNRGAVIFSEYGLTDIFLAAFLLIMAVQLLSERKKGLVYLVRSTAGGRAVLYFQRVAVLAFSAVLAGIFLYGGNFIGMFLTYGNCGISRHIQSLPEFMECPYGITIGEYFIISAGVKILACFTLSLAFFLVISLLGTGTAYTLAAVVTAAEFILYKAIMPVSAVNVLKYINIFGIINCTEYMSVCRNLDIFGRAVPALVCGICFMTILIFILVGAGYFVHEKMYVSSLDPLQKIYDKLAVITEKFSFQRTLFGWEGYKTFIKQGGVFFIAAAFILTLTSALRYNYFYPTNYLEEKWYDEFKGVITGETLEKAETTLARLEKNIERIENQIAELLSRESYDENRLSRLTSELEKTRRDRDALVPVLENIRDGVSYTNRTGNKINLIKPYSYDLLINRDGQTRNRASLYILIGIIGAVSGIFAYDRQNNMRQTMLSSYRGRGALTASKIGTVLVACVLICVSAHLVQFAQIGKLLGYNDTDAPVQSLMFMRDFGLYISIRGYLCLLFAVRSAAAFGAGMICALISRVCADTASAMGVSVFALAVPAVFAEMIPNIDFVNAVWLIGGEYFR